MSKFDRRRNDVDRLQTRMRQRSKLSINLEFAHPQRAQLAQRCIALAEIIEAHIDAGRVELRNVLHHSSRIGSDSCFCDLDDHSCGVKFEGDQALLEPAGHRWIAHITNRHIDRHRQPRSSFAPINELPHCCVKHPSRQRADQRSGLEHVHEVARRQQSALGVAPSHQRLEAHQLSCVDLHLGLVEQLKLVFGDCMAKLCHQTEARHIGGLQLVCIANHAHASILRGVERKVGAPHQVIYVVALLGPLGPTDACIRGDRNSVELKLAADHQLDAIEDRSSRLCANTREHQTKLVAAESRRRVTRPEFLHHSLGHTVQENVAVGVTQRVVHFFESIKVDNGYRDR